MAVVNTSVFLEQDKRTILPWTIIQVVEESHSFADFFADVIRPRCSLACQLVSAFVGPCKSSLDPVDTTLQMVPVLNSFGQFLKYIVEFNESDQNSVHTSLSIDGCGSIGVRQPNMDFVTPVNVRNRKDQLYNDLISFFKSHDALLESDEVVPLGKELVKTIRDVL